MRSMVHNRANETWIDSQKMTTLVCRFETAILCPFLVLRIWSVECWIWDTVGKSPKTTSFNVNFCLHGCNETPNQDEKFKEDKGRWLNETSFARCGCVSKRKMENRTSLRIPYIWTLLQTNNLSYVSRDVWKQWNKVNYRCMRTSALDFSCLSSYQQMEYKITKYEWVHVTIHDIANASFISLFLF